MEKIQKLVEKYPGLSSENLSHLRRIQDSSLLMHRNFKGGFTELMDIIDMRKPGQLVVLTGPTNVGKTRLIKLADEMLMEQAKARGLPLWGSAYCRLPSPANARHDEGETYWRTLDALQEPLPDKKVAYPDITEGALRSSQTVRIGRSPTHKALLRSLVNRLRMGYDAVFFDEAGEIPQSLKVTALRETCNLFKQLADLAESTAVLTGGPEIGPILWESGQLAARIKVVGVAPYNPAKDLDVKEFVGLMRQLESKLGEEYMVRGTLAKDHAIETMKRCLGVFGIAQDIVLFATGRTLRRGLGPLTWEVLQALLVERMAQIGSSVKHEQALFYALSDEARRRQYWGDAGSTGFKEEMMTLPTKSQGGGDAPMKRGGTKVTVTRVNRGMPVQGVPHPARRGMHPTKPRRTPIGEQSGS